MNGTLPIDKISIRNATSTRYDNTKQREDDDQYVDKQKSSSTQSYKDNSMYIRTNNMPIQPSPSVYHTIYSPPLLIPNKIEAMLRYYTHLVLNPSPQMPWGHAYIDN